MKKVQNNYLNMAEAVLQFFDKHESIWSKIKLVVACITKTRSIVNAINAAAKKQNENNPKGYTATKEQTRDSLETAIYQTGLRVRSYARETDNEILLEKTNFSRSTLGSMPTNNLFIIANVLADACSEYLAELAEYEIDQSIIDSLRELAMQTRTLYAQRDTVIDERMEATTRLEQLFTKLRTQLKILDDLVEGFIKDDTFVATYFNARRIHDLKGRHSKTKEDGTEPLDE
jgi:hypothetical protein